MDDLGTNKKAYRKFGHNDGNEDAFHKNEEVKQEEDKVTKWLKEYIASK